MLLCGYYHLFPHRAPVLLLQRCNIKLYLSLIEISSMIRMLLLGKSQNINKNSQKRRCGISLWTYCMFSDCAHEYLFSIKEKFSSSLKNGFCSQRLSEHNSVKIQMWQICFNHTGRLKQVKQQRVTCSKPGFRCWTLSTKQRSQLPEIS